MIQSITTKHSKYKPKKLRNNKKKADFYDKTQFVQFITYSY